MVYLHKYSLSYFYKILIIIILITGAYSIPILAENQTGYNQIDKELKVITLKKSEQAYIVEKSSLFDDLPQPTVGLALGGGGARALVNVGVLKALEEENIPIDMVAGTSMGAIIATMYGSGIPVSEIERMVKSNILSSLFDFNYPFNKSIINNHHLNKLIENIAPAKKLEKFPIPTALLSLNLTEGKKYIHTTGNISNVVSSSYAIPFFFPIYKNKNTYFMDPGLLELTPSLTCKIVGADFIIATTAFDKLAFDSYESPVKASMRMLKIINSKYSKEIIEQYSDIIIKHDVGDYSFMDYQLADKFIKLGYKKTRELIPVIKKRLKEANISLQHNDYNYSQKYDPALLTSLISDYKNNRITYNHLSLTPGFYYGKDYSLFSRKQRLFINNLLIPQYDFKIKKGKLELELYTNGNKAINLETRGRIIKIYPAVDLSFIYNIKNNNTETKGINFIYYLDNSKLNSRTQLSYLNINEHNYININLNFNYNTTLNKIHLKGNSNILIPYKKQLQFTQKEYIIENQIKYPVSKSWDLIVKSVLTNTTTLTKPIIYRGNSVSEISNNKYQITLESNYHHYFPYSIEYYNTIQLSHIDLYQFIDYTGPAITANAIGAGIRTDLKLLGIKPFHLGGFVSREFENNSIKIGLDIDIKI